MFRVITFILLVLGAILLPYWIYVPALALSIIYFRFFWEGVVVGFIIDLLYGYGGGFGQYLFALSSLALLLAMLPIRDKLRLNV